jgi:hypothetical protein
MEQHLHLWKADGNAADLATAKETLDAWLDPLSPEDRADHLKGRVARAIHEAWERQGGGDPAA